MGNPFGELEWNYQKEAAKEAVVNLIGVKGISIRIKSQSDTIINSTALRLALENHYELDSQNIEIEVLDQK
jgi:osmotically-inducible protein OsmY